jgi:hypothetical protein
LARRGTERRVHAVDLNGGRDGCARCAPDSPQCEDMKGYRVLGSSSSEPVRHGLLNLAAKFPALYTKAMARNGGSFAAARAMYRAGQRQEAAEQRAEKAAAAAGTVDARALLKSSFPAAFQSAEARDGGALTDRDARSQASDEVPASANRERAESPPNSSTPPASGFEPHELHRCAPTLESAGGEGHDAVLLAARLRQGAPARQRRQSQKMQSEVSGEKRAGRRPLISKSQSSGSNFYAYVVLKRTASDEQKGKFSSAV